MSLLHHSFHQEISKLLASSFTHNWLHELVYLATSIVAMEKWLGIWHNTSGADNKITAKCHYIIGQLDVNWPVSY